MTFRMPCSVPPIPRRGITCRTLSRSDGSSSAATLEADAGEGLIFSHCACSCMTGYAHRSQQGVAACYGDCLKETIARLADRWRALVQAASFSTGPRPFGTLNLLANC